MLNVFLLAALQGPALAQDTVDVGVLKDSDVSVVQKKLYPKEGRLEVGAHAGWMPFDAYTTTPLVSFTGVKHLSETVAAEAAVGAGYSLKNGVFKELEGPAYGISPDAYRYLGSVVANAQWSPIYAKMNWRGARVFHHDLYGLAGAGVTIEQAMMPDNSIAVAPTVSLGLGARIFLGDGAGLRVQVRDDVLYEKRIKTADTKAYFIKQNVAVTVGYTRQLGQKG